MHETASKKYQRMYFCVIFSILIYVILVYIFNFSKLQSLIVLDLFVFVFIVIYFWSFQEAKSILNQKGYRVGLAQAMSASDMAVKNKFNIKNMPSKDEVMMVPIQFARFGGVDSSEIRNDFELLLVMISLNENSPQANAAPHESPGQRSQG